MQSPLESSAASIRARACCAIAFAALATNAAANDFTISPNISGGFGHYNWSIAIDGAAAAANPDLTLVTGQTYTLHVNTTPIHPFWIKTSPSTGTLNGYAGTGLSANGVTAATTVTFVVPADAPNTLYYNCGNHPEMTGIINVIVDPIFQNGFEPPQM